MTAPQTEGRASRRRGSLAWWVLGVGMAIAAIGIVGLMSSTGSILVQAATSPPLTSPGVLTVAMTPDEWAVYQLTGISKQVGPVTTTNQRALTISPRQVVVTGPDRVTLSTTRPSMTETIDLNGQIYTAAALFTVTQPGDHTVEVKADGGQVIVAKRVSSVLKSTVPWVVAMVLGGIVAFVGLILVIVSSRRSRGTPPAWPPGGGPGYGPPPGYGSPPGYAAPPGYGPPPAYGSPPTRQEPR